MEDREKAGQPLFRFHFDFMGHKELTMEIRSKVYWRATETLKRRLARAERAHQALLTRREGWMNTWNARCRQYKYDRDKKRGTLNINELTFFDLLEQGLM